jgi:hypothetical protein
MAKVVGLYAGETLVELGLLGVTADADLVQVVADRLTTSAGRPVRSSRSISTGLSPSAEDRGQWAKRKTGATQPPSLTFSAPVDWGVGL